MLTKRHMGGLLASVLSVALVVTLCVVAFAPRTPHVDVIARGSRVVAATKARVLRHTPLARHRSIEKQDDEEDDDDAEFYQGDADHDGVLSPDEFSAMPKSNAVFRGNKEQIARMFAFLDTDGSNTLSLAEFNASPSAEAAPWFAKTSIENFDDDGDELLDAKEFYAHMKAMSTQHEEALPPEAAGAMMRMADSDGDGKLSAKEYADMLSRMGDGEEGSGSVSQGKLFDLNSDGFVDVDEMMQMMTAMHSDEEGSVNRAHIKLLLCQIDDVPPVDYSVPVELVDARMGDDTAFEPSHAKIMACYSALDASEQAEIMASADA